MLKLTYTRLSDRFQTVTVLGDANGIRDLYWQLTHNYVAKDGSAFGTIKVTNLDGVDCTDLLFTASYLMATALNTLNA